MTLQPLTSWLGKNMHSQRAWTQPDNTHFLDNQEQALSADFVCRRFFNYSQTGEKRQVSLIWLKCRTKTTHFLKSKREKSSTGLKHSKILKPLTNWGAKCRHDQEARHCCHSHAGESRIGKNRHHQWAWSTANYCRYSLSKGARLSIIRSRQT